MTAPTPASAMPFAGGVVLLGATGFVDAYTYLAHGRVFAEAMTGNLVLVGVGVVDPGIVPFWRPLLSFGCFVVGVALAWLLGRAARGRTLQVVTLSVLVVVLAVAGLLPASFPDAAAAGPISFAAGLQIAAFTRIGRTRFTTIVMTSNTLATVNATLAAVASRSREDARTAARLAGSLGSFVIGAVVGAVVTGAVGGRAGLVAAALFVLAGGGYLARPPAPNPPDPVG